MKINKIENHNEKFDVKGQGDECKLDCTYFSGKSSLNTSGCSVVVDARLSTLL